MKFLKFGVDIRNIELKIVEKYMRFKGGAI